MFRILLVLPLLAALAGCATTSSTDRIGLRATPTSPVDVELKWTNPATNAAGYIVEWTPNRTAAFVIIAFVPPYRTTHVHRDLMPNSECFYRVRAFYGPASSPIEVRLPANLSDTDYRTRYDQPEDFFWATPKTLPTAHRITTSSLHRPETVATAAPTDFKAELKPVTVSGFNLTWTDHASDEEGFMLEYRPEKYPDYGVCAIIKPNINSFGYAFEPPVRSGSFRVRPFFYSKPSNTLHLHTGAADPKVF